MEGLLLSGKSDIFVGHPKRDIPVPRIKDDPYRVCSGSGDRFHNLCGYLGAGRGVHV